MQEELLQFKLQQLWTLMDLPYGKRAIGTKWVYKNKKDERGIVIRNKARLVAQGYTQEEGIDYDEQTIVANSTTEAEYVAASSCYGHVLWIQNQMLDYGYNFMNTKIFIDNESTIFIVKNPVFHSKTKQIEIRHHFIRDSYEKRFIQVIKIHTDHNVADLLTKAFDVSRFQYLIASIMTSCYGHVLWIQNQMLDYGYNFMNTKIFIDNESTICIVKNPVFHSKTKQIEIRHHFIRDSYEKRFIQVIKIHIDHNVADLLTKAFEVSRFQYLIATKDEIQVSAVRVTYYNGPIPFVADDTVIKEWEDRMERAATTASSL
ncbi:putative ribonuclease H-like domain-containing protein [Tanacetum coccineum]